MKNTYGKKAIQLYKKGQGNFCTAPTVPLKKESDLASFYYPGINEVVKKIEMKPEHQEKMCRLSKTIGVISTKSTKLFPVASAKAALFSAVSEGNAIPLMIRYKNPKKIGEVLQSVEVNFQLLFCTNFSPKEKEIAQQVYKGKKLLLFDDQMQAAAVVAAVMNGAKLLKKQSKKVRITGEGSDELMKEIVHLLVQEGFQNISLLDERGPLYRKRPNMNAQKKALVEQLKQGKDNREREEVLSETDIYIHTIPENIPSTVTTKLPEKAVIIALKSENIDAKPKQSIVSTLPQRPNHLTDLHVLIGISQALSEGKKWSQKSLSQAISALASVYKSPKKEKIIPGLLEKNLASKIAKGMK